jgi:hypothetical protein
MMVKSVSNPISIGGNWFSEFNFGKKVITVSALQFDDEMPGNHVYCLLDSQNFLGEVPPAVASFNPPAKNTGSATGSSSIHCQ